MTVQPLRVRVATPGDAAAYDRFLLQHPESLLYHSGPYISLLAELLHCTDHTLVAIGGDRIQAVLPMMRLDTPHGAVYNSMPYYGSNGGVIADSDAARTALIDEYNRIAAERSTLASTIVANPLLGGILAGVRHNHTDIRTGFLTALDGADVLTRIGSTARRNVQKAERSGLEVYHEAEAIERTYELHHENMTAIGGPPKSRRFFDLIAKYFIYGTDYAVYAARKNGRVIATLLVFFFNETVEYYTPSIEEAYRSDQPLSLLCLTAMRDAAQRGFKWWNWGGTHASQTGVYRFKRKWATREQIYHYYTQLNDGAVLDWPGERFREEFPNFYVVPFGALRKGSTS